MKTSKSYKITVLSGDGIGPEIMAEAAKLIESIIDTYQLDIQLLKGLIGGTAIDSCGEPLPLETRNLCENSDAVLLGSIGGPEWDHLPPAKRPEIGGLLALRKMLNLYANIRPVTLFTELLDISPLSTRIVEDKVDLVTVRELAHGIYFGKPRNLSADEGFDTMRYSSSDVRRVAEVAFQMAANRKGKVTSVDKANVLHSSMLWRKTVTEMAKNYPGVKLEHMYVDNAAMQMVLNPQQFDVILTTNLFGDILSDESAALSGSLGMLPSASLGESIHLYEPAGGSAPDIAGKGIANPVAQILSVAMMMEHSFQRVDISRDICQAVERTIRAGFRTRDIAGPGIKPVTTSLMGDAICRYFRTGNTVE